MCDIDRGPGERIILSIMAHDVFVSYSSEDKSTADAICATLERDRIRCWIAPRDVLPGVPYAEALIEGIRGSRILILVFSAKSNTSPHVMREVERAVSLGLPVIPLRIEDVLPSKAMEYYLSTPHWLDAMSPPLEAHLDRLARTVRVLLDGPGPRDALSGPAKPSGPPPQPPGLSFAGIIGNPSMLAGTRIGAYTVQEHLGSGGSGLVFRAVNAALAQEACLKIFYPFKPEFSGVTATIIRGVRGLAALNHPHIVRILDFGSVRLADASSFYVAMEFVPGETLGRWTQRAEKDARPNRLARRFDIAVDLADALHAAHHCSYVDEVGFEQRGILHGDIKPANVIVRPDGSPVLLDFMMIDVMRLLDPQVVPGLLEEPGTSLTKAFGTPGFMAPEQEERGQLSVLTDIYGLGVTLIHLFFPKEEDWPQSWSMDHSEDGLDALRALIRDMTCYAPGKRPDSAAMVRARLIEIAAHRLDPPSS